MIYLKTDALQYNSGKLIEVMLMILVTGELLLKPHKIDNNLT